MQTLVTILLCMETLRPINIKQGKTANPNNSFSLERKKELLGWVIMYAFKCVLF